MRRSVAVLLVIGAIWGAGTLAAQPTRVPASYLPQVGVLSSPTTVVPTATLAPTATATTTATQAPTATAPVAPSATSGPGPNCAPEYPTVCIPPPPSDLDCGDIPYRDFVVLSPDRHRFDRNNDGVGCESD